MQPPEEPTTIAVEFDAETVRCAPPPELLSSSVFLLFTFGGGPFRPQTHPFCAPVFDAVSVCRVVGIQFAKLEFSFCCFFLAMVGGRCPWIPQHFQNGPVFLGGGFVGAAVQKSSHTGQSGPAPAQPGAEKSISGGSIF